MYVSWEILKKALLQYMFSAEAVSLCDVYHKAFPFLSFL